MKRVVRSLLLFFCTTLFMLSAIVCVCVVRVHADTTTYYSFGSGCVEIAHNTNNTRYFNVYVQNNVSEVRGVILHNPSSSSDGTFYIISKNSFDALLFNYASSGCQASISGYVNYPVHSSGYAGASMSYSFSRYPTSVVPIIDTTNVTFDNAYYYTFGEGAVGPVAPTNWGLVDVEGYQTNIAGQGQAAIHNVDVITWDSSTDTNGNDISDGNVRIRFIPGEYRSSSKNDLFSQTSNDFILDIQNASTGNVFPVSAGSASFKWSDVIDTLNLSSISFFNTIHDNDMWLKRGWIYEIRLEIDDYIGEWQTIYSSTSSGVENDLTIVNTSVITQNTITAIQAINSLNSTTNIWIVNGQPVDPNPEQTPPESEDEKPWWVYLLEMINNTLGIQNEYINEGTDESIEVVNNFEGDHTELNTTVEDYDDIENNLVLDMNNNLEQIEVESDLIENNSFLSSARWVAEQYTTIITDNPFGSILKFSLVLGFVMIFLGRFK